MRKYWITGLTLAIVVSGFALWFWHELSTPYYGAQRQETFIDVVHGTGINAIADALERGGVLHRRLPFLIYLRWTGKAGSIKAGEYRFAAPETPPAIVKRLVKGDVYFRTLTVPEGLTAKEVFALMAGAGLTSEPMQALIGRVQWISEIAPGARNLEGYLFPDTYRFSRRTTAEQLVKAMVEQFRIRIKNLLAGKPAPARTIPETVILASMIEKEAKTPEERRLVASVLVNRLRLKMPLACDPTIIYALKEAGTYDGNLHKADLALASPYNTYLHAGLPPGPISNPGADSLEAALAPAETDYLYYVSRNDGTHVFSRDLRAHNLAVDMYQRRGKR